MNVLRLPDLSNARHFHDWGLPLALCKSSGPSMIRVDTSKSFAVSVKQSHLPVMVFSALVFLE